jgi:hypothetical protein
MLNIKFGPELLIMLPLAIGLDLAGFILLFAGIPDMGIIVAIGTIFINSWLLLRGKKSGNNNGKLKFLKKIFTGKISKFITPFIIEMIPYVSGAMFTWTLVVIMNLLEDDAPN